MRTYWNPQFTGGDGKTIERVTVTKVGRKYPLSITQDHFSIEGRGVVREATLAHYREENDFVEKAAGLDEAPPHLPTIYSHPALSATYQWGMNVDLNVC